MRKVAALFVDEKGIYPEIRGVDVYGKSRDARNYSDSLPVVAHPPCNLWTNFAFVNYARWGGAHNKPGNDLGCFMSALANVRRCGGVLEHPASSHAWRKYKLMRPECVGWQRVCDNEYVCEIWQSAYGCLARKKTWLLYVGCRRPFALRWLREPGTHQIGFHDQRGKSRNLPTISGRAASATPPDLARALVKLAWHGRLL